MTADDFLDHEDDLSELFDACVSVEHRRGGRRRPSARAHYSPRQVTIDPGFARDPECRYWTMLHEFGHFATLCQNVRGEDEPGRIGSETNAWLWALGEARCRPSERAVAFMLRCLATYIATDGGSDARLRAALPGAPDSLAVHPGRNLWDQPIY